MALDCMIKKYNFKNEDELYNALEGVEEIKNLGKTTLNDLKSFCTANYKKIPEIAADQKGIKGFKWPKNGVNFKIFSRNVAEYLNEHKKIAKDDKGLIEVMTDRNWG